MTTDYVQKRLLDAYERLYTICEARFAREQTSPTTFSADELRDRAIKALCDDISRCKVFVSLDVASENTSQLTLSELRGLALEDTSVLCEAEACDA